MKIIDLKDLKNFKDNTCISLGFFDGMHLGHQKILENLVKKAKEKKCKSLIITFKDDVLNLFKMTNCINNLDAKLASFNDFNIDYVLLLGVNDNFMSLSASEFINTILKPLNCKAIVCGNDLSFAKNKEGNIDYIKNNTTYDILIVDDVYVLNNKISSTFIRKLLLNGKVDEANKLLYKPFMISSKVINGKKIGRSIGFKTANILLNESCYLLKHGVYFGYVEINGNKYKAMINVGYNPTIKDEILLKVEAHILSFNETIYDENIKVYFNKFHREEIKFASLEKLKLQLQNDLIELNNFND